MKKGHMFVITWLAWSWKWTMIKMLLNDTTLDLELILSYKTRSPRKWEVVWIDYNYLTKDEFKKSIDNGEFLEYNFVHNQDYYWTKLEDVLSWIKEWRNFIKEIDVLSWKNLIDEKKIDREDITFIFLDIPIELIKERMLLRWDDINWEDYKNRIESAEKEKLQKHLADYIVDWTWTKEEEYLRLKKVIINHI